MKHLVLSAAALAFSVSAVPAATVNFQFTDGASVVASGSFTYDNALDGSVIGYADLSSFSFTILDTYDLDFIQTTTLGAFVHLAWDSAVDSFQSVSIGSFPTILAALAADLGSGFFVRPLNDVPIVGDYGSDPLFTVVYDGLSTSVDRSLPPIPVPASAVLLIGALGGLAALRRRKTAA